VELTPATAIRSERVRWLDAGRIPLGGLTVAAGEKGLGKSILTNARLVADATRGRLSGELAGTPVDVLVCTAEDDWASVVKPRLVAHGADLDRVHRVRAVDDAGTALLTLPDDVARLGTEVDRLREEGRTVGLIVVDPIGAFIGAGTDTHRDASVRRVLAPLAEMAERLDVAVLVVAHLTKDESSRLINRVSGAGAFVNAARSLLVLARSPSDPDGERGSDRVLVHVASNWGRLAPSLALRVESRDVALDDGTVASVGCMRLVGESDVSVEDLQRGPDENGADVEETICAALAAGPRPSRDVKTAVRAELECSTRTVERAAKRMEAAGELIVASGGFPRTTTWTLAGSDTIDSAVATNANPLDVATGSSDVGIENATASSDTDESHARLVATTPATDDEEPLARRLFAAHPDIAQGGPDASG
jgi:hypothetical protein